MLWNMSTIKKGQEGEEMHFLRKRLKLLRHFSKLKVENVMSVIYLNMAIGKEPACQCRSHTRHGFNPWVEKIPWRRA